ncbi:MAG: leucyl aminopeptidase [Actinomycetota bacterium]|nr:leucyl aminopeptidase [Actinomycetota bacterium]
MAPSFRIVADAPKADLFVVPVFTGARPGPGADLVDDAVGGTLAEFVRETEFDGKRGEVLAVPTGGRLRARSVLLLGVGDQETFDAAAIRRTSAVLAKRAAHAATVATTLLDAVAPDVDRALAAQAFAEGVSLGRYQFLRYKSDAKASELARVLVVTKPDAKVRAGLARGARIAEAVLWARDLINEPAAAKSPADVAELAKGIARTSGLKAKVYAGEQLVRARMGGVLGVGNGSDRPPRFLRLEYAPANAKGTLALVGKGVVFDSGGLSLKTAGGMETMKTDMSGAAAVIAAMSTLRDLGVKSRVIAYVPLVENMPSGAAMRPGDVLTMRNGKTVEVLNTDAEGRLILADALSLASEEGADAIIDLATLTGAVTMALGDKIAGLMGTDDAWIAQVSEAAERAGERMWHLPLPEDYRRNLDSEIADLRNISSGGGAGTLTAGLFLKEFTGDAPWVHLDIAGTARASSEDAETSKGGTGYGVRTLVELASTFRKP